MALFIRWASPLQLDIIHYRHRPIGSARSWSFFSLQPFQLLCNSTSEKFSAVYFGFLSFSIACFAFCVCNDLFVISNSTNKSPLHPLCSYYSLNYIKYYNNNHLTADSVTWILSLVSLQLDSSNVSLWVWWMMRQEWDWNSLCRIISTSWLFSHGWRVSWFHAPHFEHLHCVCLDSCISFTAAWQFQCLIISKMNDETRLRLEFIVQNGLHKLTF